LGPSNISPARPPSTEKKPPIINKHFISDRFVFGFWVLCLTFILQVAAWSTLDDSALVRAVVPLVSTGCTWPHQSGVSVATWSWYRRWKILWSPAGWPDSQTDGRL